MDALRESREKVNYFLSLYSYTKEKSWNKNKYNLEQIQEENESSTIKTSSVHSNRASSFSFIPKAIDQSLNPKPTSQFLCAFLQSLQKAERVYSYFIIQASVRNLILRRSPRIRRKTLGKTKAMSITPTDNGYTSLNEEESDISDILEPVRSVRGGILESGKQKYPIFRSRLKMNDETRSKDSSSLRTITPALKPGRYFDVNRGIKINTLQARDIFDEMACNRPKCTSEDFKNYLMKRYPEPVAESICQFFNLKPCAFEEFINEINRFIRLEEIMQLQFCFNIFDFNKDKIICYKDAFKALELRTANYYDDDIALISEMFGLKKEGITPIVNKLRRKSTLSLIKERLVKNKRDRQKSNDDKKKHLEHKEEVVKLPCTISFKEFCTLKFNSRPQIFLDFLQYICQYNFLKEKGFLIPIPIHKKKNSEEIVLQMNLNPDFQEILRKNDKFEYYCSLDEAMSMYSKPELDDLLKKFAYLQSEDSLRLKVITKESMSKKWVLYK